jgi:MYXO-CTERM domain-containing protein
MDLAPLHAHADAAAAGPPWPAFGALLALLAAAALALWLYVRRRFPIPGGAHPGPPFK